MNKIRITTHRYAYMGLAYDTIIKIACKLKGEYKNDVCFNHNGKQWTLSEGQGDFEYVEDELENSLSEVTNLMSIDTGNDSITTDSDGTLTTGDFESAGLGLPNTIKPQDIVEGRFVNPLNKQVSGDHYKTCSVQPIEYIHANGLDYFQGNVVKYVTRHKNKNKEQDVLKAIHYLELILELQYGYNEK